MHAKSNQLPEERPNLVARLWVFDLQDLAEGDHAQGLLLKRNSQLLTLLQ